MRLIRRSTCAVGLSFLAPAAASADSYLVTSCHDPAGKPNAAAGWASSFAGTGLTFNACALNGGLSAVLASAAPGGDSTANWRFNAPPGTKVVRVMARRSTYGLFPSLEPQDISYLLRTDSALLESCAPSPTSSCVANLSGAVDKQGLNGKYVEMRVLCTNAGSVCTRSLGVNATHAYVALEDPQAPVVSGFKVTDNGDSSGKLRVRFNALDVGGGLYRTLIKVDGKVTKATPLAAAPCADSGPGDSNPYQFNVPVPCPGTVTNAQGTVDVRELSPGPHGVEIAVEDAAGNQRAVYGPTQFPTLNGPTGSSVVGDDDLKSLLRAKVRTWFARGKRKLGGRHTSLYGTRVVTRGTLKTSKGRGIQGARVDVYHIRRDGKRRLLKTGLKSRRFGRLTLILPNNVDTRRNEFAYRAVRPGPITSRVRLRLKVLRKGAVFYRPSKSKQ